MKYQEKNSTTSLGIVAAILIITSPILYFAYHLYNTTEERKSAQQFTQEVTVESKYYSPTYGAGGSSMSRIHIPEKWIIIVHLNNKTISCDASKAQYKSIEIGDKTTAILGIGDYSGNSYCYGIK